MPMDQIKNKEVESAPNVFEKRGLKRTSSMGVELLLVWCSLSQQPEVKGSMLLCFITLVDEAMRCKLGGCRPTAGP